MNLRNNYEFKFTVFGDSQVGKSNLIRRFAEKKLIVSDTSRHGVSITNKEINLGNDTCDLHLWNAMPGDHFKSFLKSYHKNSDAFLIAVDLTNRSSFKNLNTWLEAAKNLNKTSPIIIIGTKSDLKSQRKVSGKEIADWCTEKNLPYVETSSKDDANVTLAFALAASLTVSPNSNDSDNYDNVINQVQNILDQKSSCAQSSNNKETPDQLCAQVRNLVKAKFGELDKEDKGKGKDNVAVRGGVL